MKKGKSPSLDAQGFAQVDLPSYMRRERAMGASLANGIYGAELGVRERGCMVPSRGLYAKKVSVELVPFQIVSKQLAHTYHVVTPGSCS
jgi:hypothetical protein